MIHVIIGILAIAWGLWLLLPDWMFVSQLLKIMLFVGLVGFGLVAVLAGLRKFKRNN